MSQSQIVQAIAKHFPQNEDGQVVFWNDVDGEFIGLVDSLDLPNVKVMRLDQTPALKAKMLLETHVAGSSWLVYSPSAEPDPASDWLLDIRLRSKIFRADSTSILLEELGLATQSVRPYIKTRLKFLRAKDRVERLRRWTDPNDGPGELDRKMIGTLVRAESPDVFSILLKIFSALASEGSGDLDVIPKPLQEMIANELAEPFWELMANEIGYRDEKPSLRGLLFTILATDFARSIASGLPSQLLHFVVSQRAQGASATVFAGRWRSDMANYGSYNALSAVVASELRLADILAAMDAEALYDAMTFEEIERRIIKDIKDRVIGGHGANMDSVRAIIARRRDGHWASRLLAKDGDAILALSASYDALEAAAEFFELQARHQKGFSFTNAADGFAAYRREIFRFDQLYRRFMRAAETVEPMGWAVLHELRERIEDAYSGWFMPQLSSAWGAVIEGKEGLLSSWRLDGVVSQQEFYKRLAVPVFDGGSKRLFVIISDAFRFEAAEELTRELNSKSRVKASLEAMLGVLPSYTALGMASLLPHDTLAYKTNANLDVMADGLMASTTEQRAAILARHGGVAIKREDLMEKGKEKGREFVKPYKLIYIYHDLIDMIGDKQGSETKTFQAVADAIEELAALVGYIINSLNGSAILITADHGFLYQESAMEEADRSALDEKPAGALRAKKRYLIGQGLGQNAKAWSGNTAQTAGTDVGADSMDFWVPKGAARFHFAGGARFVHGSAMLQEIVVPVITVKESETEQAKTRSVEVSVLGSSNKVVTNKQRFEFIQTEAVSERVLPITLLVSLRDGEKLISDEQSITFDSVSQLLDERKRSLILTVSTGTYERTKDYYLIGRDAKTKVEVIRIPVKVDLAFSNDF